MESGESWRGSWGDEVLAPIFECPGWKTLWTFVYWILENVDGRKLDIIADLLGLSYHVII
jgi:hypothetical protein